jgi:hypothetical protein
MWKLGSPESNPIMGLRTLNIQCLATFVGMRYEHGLPSRRLPDWRSARGKYWRPMAPSPSLHWLPATTERGVFASCNLGQRAAQVLHEASRNFCSPQFISSERIQYSYWKYRVHEPETKSINVADGEPRLRHQDTQLIN